MDAESPPPEARPNLAEVPPDERDRVWHQTYYQGNVPQLTLRAVLMGGVLGMVMSVTNLYTTLKIGWSFGVAITACVLSYAIWNSFVALGLTKSKMTILENNCMQSTASAAGYSTGGTLATAAGALLLIGGDENRMGWVSLTGWVFFVAVLGVFLAVPMKRQMINRDQLPFPSGIAAAETLRSLYAEGAASVAKARNLIDSMVAGAAVGLARSFAIIPEVIPFGLKVATARGPVGLGALGLSFEPSLLLVAAGGIVGLRVSASMLLGAVLNYAVLVPLMMGLPDWVQEGKTFMGHVEVVLGEGGAIEVVKGRSWTLWGGTAILVGSGLTSFALNWRTLLRAVTGARTGRAADDPLEAIEVPTSWMVIGLVPTTLGLVLVCWLAMGIHPALGLLSVVMSGFLALVACRATGETDTTPIGAMGKITQFVYAVLAPADKTVNLMTAGVTAGAAGSSADLLTDLKSGYLLGANPRQQFLAQFIGVFFGTAMVIPMWYVMVPSADSELLHGPATTLWYAVAEALAGGVQTIPLSARYAIVAGALLGVALPIIEDVFPKAKRYLPSSMGLGLSGVITFSSSLGFFIGAAIAARWIGRNPKVYEDKIIPMASGAVAGESLAAAAVAVLNGLKVIIL